MKRFFRTAAGKALLFFLLALNALLLLLSAAGITFLIVGEGYSLPPDAVLEDLRESYCRRFAVRAGFGAGDRIPAALEYRVTAEDGTVLSESDGYAARDSLRGDPDAVREYLFPYEYTRWEDAEDDPAGSVPWEHRPGREILVTETVSLLVDPAVPIDDAERLMSDAVRFVYEIRFAIWAVAAAALVLVLLLFFSLTGLAGRLPQGEEFVPGPLSAVPFEIPLAAFLLFGFAGTWFLSHAYYGDLLMYAAAGAFLLVLFLLFTGLCMGLISRVRQHRLLRDSLICRFFRALGAGVRALFRLIRKIPLVPKTALLLLFSALAEILLVSLIWVMDAEGFFLIFILWEAVKAVFVLWIALSLRKLQNTGRELAAGKFDTEIPLKGLPAELRTHAEDLNSISRGMELAVGERIKSERMKTELITNVSHDLKTPLTSVVNYALLIGDEPTENEKIREYAEVLVRQSDRLKRLIEDLIEASKAATGNLEVLPVPCSAATLITQAAGEYGDRIEKAGLTLVTSVPGEEITILADSRRMWRVFDNLLGNAIKYSLPGTRVWITLKKEAGQAVIAFKNTSRAPLDLSPEELTERFVQGDPSRSTEGNGLGLSITGSLTELQGGKMTVETDGDLFKVTLRFPAVKG